MVIRYGNKTEVLWAEGNGPPALVTDAHKDQVSGLWVTRCIAAGRLGVPILDRRKAVCRLVSGCRRLLDGL